MKQILRSALASTVFLLLAACAGTSNASGSSTAAAMNANCPLSGEKIDPACTTSYEGKTVGFCCNNCKGKFEAMSAADKKAKVAAMK